MLDSFLNSSLVVCAQSGDAKDLHTHFPDFIVDINDFCNLPGDYEQKCVTLQCLERLLDIIACSYEEICKSCQQMILKVADYVSHVRTKILKPDSKADDSHAKAPKTRGFLVWNGKRTQLCEKCYEEFVMQLTGSEGKEYATLSSIIEAYNILYDMDITEDECHDALRKMKERKGKGYPDYKNNIPVRAYHAYDAHRKLEEYMIQQEAVCDGRKQPRFKAQS